MKKCPKCASLVPVEATVCAHCRSRLVPAGPGWWTASDGVTYPPWQHPDYASAPPAPMAARTKKRIVVGLAVATALFFGSALAWRADLFGMKCDSYRQDLVEAKVDSDGYSPDVAVAARAARANGCDVDDLIAPSVGR